MKIEINCVKLQRELRDQANQKYQGLSLREEMEQVRKSLRQKNLSHLFPETEKEKTGPEGVIDSQGERTR